MPPFSHWAGASLSKISSVSARRWRNAASASAGVVAQILTLLGHAIGVGVAEPGVDVHDPDLLDARREYLLGVAQVADDLLGRPVLGVGSAGENAVALALDGGGQLVGGAGEAPHALLARLPGVVFHRRHLGFPSTA